MPFCTSFILNIICRVYGTTIIIIKQAGRQAGSGKSSSSNTKKRSKTLLCHGMKFIRSFEQRRGRVLGEWERENEMRTGKLEINFVLGGMKWVSSGCYCHRRRRRRRSFVRCCESTHKIEIMVWGFSPVRQKRFASFIHLGCYCESSQNLACKLSFFPLPDNNFRYKIFHMKLQYIHLADRLWYICSCIFFYQCRVHSKTP